MATVKPFEALGYALSRELALLYAVAFAGYAAVIVSGWFAANWALRGSGAGVVGQRSVS